MGAHDRGVEIINGGIASGAVIILGFAGAVDAPEEFILSLIASSIPIVSTPSFLFEFCDALD